MPLWLTRYFPTLSRIQSEVLDPVGKALPAQVIGNPRRYFFSKRFSALLDLDASAAMPVTETQESDALASHALSPWQKFLAARDCRYLSRNFFSLGKSPNTWFTRACTKVMRGGNKVNLRRAARLSLGKNFLPRVWIQIQNGGISVDLDLNFRALSS